MIYLCQILTTNSYWFLTKNSPVVVKCSYRALLDVVEMTNTMH
jgi:hypothetical protein